MGRMGIAILIIGSLFISCSKSFDSVEIVEARKLKSFEMHRDLISPLTAVNQHVLDKQDIYRIVTGSDKNSIFSISDTSKIEIDDPISHELRWDNVKGNWQFTVLDSNKANIEKLAFNSGDTLHSGQFLIQIYGSRLMIFSPFTRLREIYQGLSFFEPNSDWTKTVSVKWISEPDTVKMLTSLGLEKSYLKAAKLSFKHNGEKLALFMYTPASSPDEYGFIPFTDITSGNESYGGGRYIDIHPLERKSRLIVDFNSAYNPYCAYTSLYNCPIPPAENYLDVAVLAGEKVFDNPLSQH